MIVALTLALNLHTEEKKLLYARPWWCSLAHCTSGPGPPADSDTKWVRLGTLRISSSDEPIDVVEQFCRQSPLQELYLDGADTYHRDRDRVVFHLMAHSVPSGTTTVATALRAEQTSFERRLCGYAEPSTKWR